MIGAKRRLPIGAKRRLPIGAKRRLPIGAKRRLDVGLADVARRQKGSAPKDRISRFGNGICCRAQFSAIKYTLRGSS
jgi:hypothetical protein